MPLLSLWVGRFAFPGASSYYSHADGPRLSCGVVPPTFRPVLRAKSRQRSSAEVATASSQINGIDSWSTTGVKRPTLPTAEELNAFQGSPHVDRRVALARAYCPTVKYLARHGQYPDAWKLFCMLRSHKAKVAYSVYHSIIVAALEADEGQRAMTAYEAIATDGLKPNAVTRCVLINGLLRSSPRKREDSLRAARDVWQRFVDDEASGRITMDRISLASGINVCSEAGDMAEASRLLQRMISLELHPGFREYNMLIKGHGNLGDVAAVEHVLSTMRNRGVEATVETYNSVVRAHCLAGDAAAAVAVIDAQRRAGTPLDERAWGNVLQVHVSNSDREAAEDVVARMQAAGVRPSAYTYAKLITLYARALPLWEAKQAATAAWRDMLGQGVVPTVAAFNAMLGVTLQDSPSLEAHAQQAIADMRARGLRPTVDTCNTVMTAALAQDDALLAITVYSMLLQEGLQPDTVTSTLLMTAFEGQPDESERIFDQMRAPDIAAYRALVAIFARSNRTSDAWRVLVRLREICRREARVQELMPAYSALAAAYARVYRSENAVLLLREFNREGGIPDKQFLETVLASCVETGKLKYAQQIVRAMQLSGIEVDIKKFQDIVDSSSERVRGQEQDDEGLSPQQERMVVAFERFKFWLGIGNSYYHSES